MEKKTKPASEAATDAAASIVEDKPTADQATLLTEADAASAAATQSAEDPADSLTAGSEHAAQVQPAQRAVAVALLDIPRLNLKAGQLLDATASEVRALEQDGQLDANPAAVQHARDNGADVIRVG